MSSRNIPSRWEELSPIQFIDVLELLLRFRKEEFSERELQVRLAVALTKNPIIKIHYRNTKWIDDRIFQHLDKMNFCFKYIYDDSRFKQLDRALQEKLSKIPPEQMTEDPEISVARSFKRSVEIDAYITKQLLPSIYVKRGFRKMPGYRFERKGNIIDTSLTAEQYVDAMTALQQLVSSKDPIYANIIMAILYCPGEYSSTKANKITNLFINVPEIVKSAVLFNFEGILGWLCTNTKYSLMFNRSSSKEKQPLGINAVIFSFVEKGYGNLNEVGSMNLMTFFELMYKNIVDAARQLREADMDRVKIAERLNLTIEQLNTIL